MQQGRRKVVYGLFGNVYVLVVCLPEGNSISAQVIVEAVAAGLGSIRGGRWRKGSLELNAEKLMESYSKTYKAVKKVLDAEGGLDSAGYPSARRLSAFSRADAEASGRKGASEQALRLQEAIVEKGELLQKILDETSAAIDRPTPIRGKETAASPVPEAFDLLGHFDVPSARPETQDPFRTEPGQAEGAAGFATFEAFGDQEESQVMPGFGFQTNAGEDGHGWGPQDLTVTKTSLGDDSESDSESRQGESRFSESFPAAFISMFSDGQAWDHAAGPGPGTLQTAKPRTEGVGRALEPAPSAESGFWASNNPFETAPEGDAPFAGPSPGRFAWNIPEGGDDGGGMSTKNSTDQWGFSAAKHSSAAAPSPQKLFTLTETVRGRFEGRRLHSLGCIGELTLGAGVASSGAGGDLCIQTRGLARLKNLSYNSNYLAAKPAFQDEAYNFSLRQSAPLKVGSSISQPLVAQYLCASSSFASPVEVEASTHVAPDGSGLYLRVSVTCSPRSNLVLREVSCTCYFGGMDPGCLEPVKTAPGGALWSSSEVALLWKLGDLGTGASRTLRAFVRCAERVRLLEACRSVAARVRFNATERTASGLVAERSTGSVHTRVVGDFEAVQMPRRLSFSA